MSLDDALELAGQVLADYETADAQDAPGLALVWAGQLADILRKLALAARHAVPAGPLANATPAGCPAGGPGGRSGVVRGWLPGSEGVPRSGSCPHAGSHRYSAARSHRCMGAGNTVACSVCR